MYIKSRDRAIKFTRWHGFPTTEAKWVSSDFKGRFGFVFQPFPEQNNTITKSCKQPLNWLKETCLQVRKIQIPFLLRKTRDWGMQRLVTRTDLKLLTLAGTLGCWKWLAWQHWGSSYFPRSSCRCILGHTWAWVSPQLPESLPIQRLLVLYHYLLAHSLSKSNKIFFLSV